MKHALWRILEGAAVLILADLAHRAVDWLQGDDEEDDDD